MPVRTEQGHALAGDPRRPGTPRGPPRIRSGARRDPAVARAVSFRIEPEARNGGPAGQLGKGLDKVDLAASGVHEAGERTNRGALQYFEELHRADEGENDEGRAER